MLQSQWLRRYVVCWLRWCYTEKATETRHRLELQYNACANCKKHCRPYETKLYANATHPRKRQNKPTNDHTPNISSQRLNVSRTQGRGHTRPVNRRVTTQYLHTQSVTTRRRCGRDGKHEAPCELSAHRGISIATDQVESTVSGAVSGARNGVRLGAMEGWRHGRGAGGLGAVM